MFTPLDAGSVCIPVLPGVETVCALAFPGADTICAVVIFVAYIVCDTDVLVEDVVCTAVVSIIGAASEDMPYTEAMVAAITQRATIL